MDSTRAFLTQCSYDTVFQQAMYPKGHGVLFNYQDYFQPPPPLSVFPDNFCSIQYTVVPQIYIKLYFLEI